MSQIIHHIKDSFDFNNLSLAQPNGLQGGSYFTKLSNNENSLYIQTMKCGTKQGIVKTAKKTYCDLMFKGNDNLIVEWFENLEKKLIDLIYEKRDLWFHTTLDREDIESQFTSPIRIYKSGKYFLVRVNISHSNILNSSDFNCYDESGNSVDPNIFKDDCDLEIIPLLEIQGIKFSSRSFVCEIALKQIMLLKKEDEKFNKCLIKNINDPKKEENFGSYNKIDNMEESKFHDKSLNNEIIVNDLDSKNKINDYRESIDIDPVIEDLQDDKNINYIDTNNLGKENVKDQENETDNEEDNGEDNGEDNEEDKNNKNLEKINKDLDDELNLRNENKDLGYSENNLLDNNEKKKLDNKNIEDIEELDLNVEPISEFEVNLEKLELNDNPDKIFKLRNPNEVYTEIWREARKKAKTMRKAAIEAYLEAKNIKTTYMIDEIDNEDSDDEFDNLINKISKNSSDTKGLNLTLG